MVLTKNIKSLVSEANIEIKNISANQAIEMVRNGAILLDVREPNETQIDFANGAICIPRGLLEFTVDPDSPLYDSRINEESEIIVYCAVGGRGALAAKTLKDMGYLNVSNLVGGFTSWKESGGEIAQN